MKLNSQMLQSAGGSVALNPHSPSNFTISLSPRGAPRGDSPAPSQEKKEKMEEVVYPPPPFLYFEIKIKKLDKHTTVSIGTISLPNSLTHFLIFLVYYIIIISILYFPKFLISSFLYLYFLFFIHFPN